MQTKSLKLSLQSYLDFSDLLKGYRGDHESNRIFALKQKHLVGESIERLLLWAEDNRFRVSLSDRNEQYIKHLSLVSSFLVFFSLLIGFFVGLGLLSYSGDAPVNVIYYLAMALFLPLLSMSLALFSIFSRGELSHFFTHLFPLYWIEKLVELLPSKTQEAIQLVPATLSKWMFLDRLQRFSLFFSIGILLALIAIVVVKDIAFGWSSTLNITAEEFHSLLALVGSPWKTWLPSAIPSLELVEISHYFRLGEQLDYGMIQNADKLGAWWKFLAMSTLVYAVFLRFLFWLFVRSGYQKALKRAFLELEGVDTILREFDTPFVSTNAPKIEKHLEIIEETNEQVNDDVRRFYHDILSWNFSDDEIQLANDSKGIAGNNIFSVGGANTFEEDERIAMQVSDTVLLYVKSWEPPTMDFIDFLELLMESRQVKSIEVYPLGTAGRYYESDAKDIAVWKRKIQGLKSKKVWVIDA